MRFLLALIVGCLGCPSGPAPLDAGADGGATTPDAGAEVDAGVEADAGTPDAGTADGGSPDAGIPDAGPSTACSSGSVLTVETPDAGLARAGSVFASKLYAVTDLPARPAGWVDQIDPSILSVRVTNAGQPIPNCLVRWEAAPGHGWAFADSTKTDATGRVRAIWTAGSLSEQRLDARIDVANEGVKSVQFAGLAQPHSTRANSIHLFYDLPERWQRMRVDVTPITFPTTTYYAAIGFTGGYFGIQNRGSTVAPQLVDKWLLFSVWDTPAGNAQLVDAGPMTCQGFGGEGTGRQCYLTYDWKIGSTYRFEVSYTPGPGSAEYTAWITDVDAGVQRQLATLRYQAAVSDWSAYGFVEDWYEPGTSCLTTSERAAYFHNIAYQVGPTWKDVRSARFSRVYNEWHNEICANYFYGTEAGKFLWSSGGSQRISRPVLRTEPGYPLITLP